MPELPEVESVKLQLNKFLVGHTIEDVDIRYAKCFEGSPSKIKNSKIKCVKRFGKVVAIYLANDYAIVIHIKLTGQLIYRGPNLPDAPPISSKVADGLGGKHTHVIFSLDKGGKLYYNDFRKFGWIKVMKTDEVKSPDGFVGKLGPEPLTSITDSELEELTLENFRVALSKTRKAVKTLLLEQNKMSGIGNIYANDALWLSQIHPERPANSITESESAELFKAIETVLRSGLEYGGASELSFVTPDGGEGEYQKHFLAYGKEKEKCPRCKGNFKKIKVGGRGTVFCPTCQKKDPQEKLF